MFIWHFVHNDIAFCWSTSEAQNLAKHAVCFMALDFIPSDFKPILKYLTKWIECMARCSSTSALFRGVFTGPVPSRFNIKIPPYQYTSIAIPIMLTKQSDDRLIFKMGIIVTGKTVFILRQTPDSDNIEPVPAWLWHITACSHGFNKKHALSIS